MMTRLLSLLAFGAVVTALAAPARADFAFNPTGTGTTYTIAGFNTAPGNALAKDGVTAINNFLAGTGSRDFQLYFQTTIQSVQLPTGPFVPPGLGTPGTPGATYELTVVGSLTETVIGANSATGTATFQVAPVQGPNSFIQMYNGAGANFDSNPLAGTGFNNGTLILTGTPIASVAGRGGYTNGGVDPANPNFDTFGANNYPGIRSVSGSGVSTVDFRTTSVNPAFFPGSVPPVVGLNFQTYANTPFRSVDPSQTFAGLGPGGANVDPNIGTTNGESGPDFQFQVYATVIAVPEPSSIGLTVLGLTGVLGSRWYVRRRHAR